MSDGSLSNIRRTLEKVFELSGEEVVKAERRLAAARSRRAAATELLELFNATEKDLEQPSEDEQTS